MPRVLPSRTASPALALRGLTVRRGAAVILDGLDWTIQRGEHWALLGANGSGKTSLLAAVTGYLTPSAGEIALLGATYGRADWRELRRRVGLVSSALRQQMPEAASAREIVAGGPEAAIGLGKALTRTMARRADAALAQLDAADLRHRPWAVLSQGERQRVLIARALVGAPEVLFLDEPCAGLDPVAREKFLGSMQALAAADRALSLVLVTHHIEEIFPAITHALCLREGRVEAAGPIRRVLTSQVLSRVLSAPLRVSRHGERWRLACMPSELS